VVSEHAHAHHQLLRVERGALAFSHGAASWVVPTGGAVWLPQGLDHHLRALDDVEASVLHVRPHRRDRYPAAGPVEVSPLLDALVTRLSRPVPDPPRRKRLEQVVRDELASLVALPLVVALPTDPAARLVAEELWRAPADDRGALELAAGAGVSLRTLQRRFRDETGLSLQTWRRRAGLQHAMDALRAGASITEAAHACGFSSASAFIAAFRSELGITPGGWRRALGA
jgi:AraC-like DNA-binding protein